MDPNIAEYLNEYYNGLHLEYGDSPYGVGWNGKESQYHRFEQLSKLIDFESTFSIGDFGCGYAEYLNFLRFKKYPIKKYIGLDINDSFLSAAKIEYPQEQFINSRLLEDLPELDYYVASGVFNIHTGLENSIWTDYIKKQLDRLNKASRLGFAFNILTVYSDPEKMESYLFYADPLFWFDWCKKNFSRNVALLHDYELYEFTILVRK